MALDRRVLRNLRRELDEKTVNEIVELFVTDSRVLVEEMHNAMRAGDVDRVGRAAHTLRSTAALVGAAELARSCATLEQRAAETPPPKAIQAVLTQTSQQLDSAVAALEREMVPPRGKK